MASTPLSGIVFVNNDLSGSVQEKLISQLFIDILLTGDEFDAKVADGYYLSNLLLNNQRLMVVRSYLNNNIPNDIPNRNLADLILFVKSGLVSIVTKSGHGHTLPITNVYWGILGFN